MREIIVDNFAGGGKLKPWRPAAEIIDWSLTCPSIFERKRPLAENTMRRIARGIQKFIIDNPQPFIISYHSETFKNEVRALKLDQPIHTLDTSNRYGLIAPTLVQTGYGEKEGQAPRAPGLSKPLGTVVAGGQKHALVAAFITKFYKTGIGQDIRDPLHTITTSPGHFGEVRAFLLKYYGTGEGQTVNNPLGTVTTKDRFGLVTVEGQDYAIVDIGMRMLQPHELYAAQGFPENYIIDRDATGKKLTKTAQVKMCGNAVPPPFAEALVRSNLPELCKGYTKEYEQLSMLGSR